MPPVIAEVEKNKVSSAPADDEQFFDAETGPMPDLPIGRQQPVSSNAIHLK